MDPPKRKAPAIRADTHQTALLKSVFAVSCTPSVQAIRELSQQTGLPDKWINAWFCRQRTKARKASTNIDMTTGSSVSTGGTFSAIAPANLSTPDVMQFKTEYQEPSIDSEPPSSSPRSVATDAGAITYTFTRTAKKNAPRARGKWAQKDTIKPEPQDTQILSPFGTVGSVQALRPQLLPSVLVSRTTRGTENEFLVRSRFPIPPPTRSQEPSNQGPGNSIHPQYDLNHPMTASLVPSAGYCSTPAFAQRILPYRQGPIMRSNFRNSMPADYYSGCVETTSSHQKDLYTESSRSSSASGEVRNVDVVYTQPATNSAYEAPSVPPDSGVRAVKDTLVVPPQTWSPPSSAFAKHTVPRNVYQAVLHNYATLFPGLQPSWTEDVTTRNAQSLISEVFPSASSHSCLRTGIISSTGTDPQRTDNADCKGSQMPPPVLPTQPLEHPYCPTNVIKGTQAIPRNTNSNFLDLSGLHYDYAPLGHLQEMLEPFRLPETNYLFRREDMVDCLLDERLAVEEPFQAAMGLVLLSKLGLEW